jgi:Uma2 family endonuclease
MESAATVPSPLLERSRPDAEDADQRVILYGLTWKDYEILLGVRGDRAGVRLSYLNGALEIRSPSRSHEQIKTLLARLLEAYCDELGIELSGYGAWTLRSAPKERGAEADECYMVGATDKDMPDLALEVIWSHGGLDKLEIYRGLGVAEVWASSGEGSHARGSRPRARASAKTEMPLTSVVATLSGGSAPVPANPSPGGSLRPVDAARGGAAGQAS